MNTHKDDLPEDEIPVETTEIHDSSTGVPTGDNTMAMLCHLLAFVGLIGVPVGNILGPLVLWLVKKDQDAFVDVTGKEVLNFQISATIYCVVCLLLSFVVIGLFLLPIVIIAVIVYTIIGAIKANEGVLYRYPFTIRFFK